MKKCIICRRKFRQKRDRGSWRLEPPNGYSAHPVSFGRCCGWCRTRHVLPAREKEGITEDFDD